MLQNGPHERRPPRRTPNPRVTAAGRLTLTPRGPFALAEAIAFGFGPHRAGADDVLRLAFAADATGAPVGVELRQAEPDGPVEVTVHGDGEPDTVAAQVARIVSLDVDAAPWAALGEADAVLGRLQERCAGLRPVLFHSPYEAACWAVISARWGRAQAQSARDAIAAAHGHGFKLAGEPRHAWPGPEKLLAALDAELVTGLPGEKLRRLRGRGRCRGERRARRRAPPRARPGGRRRPRRGAARLRPVLPRAGHRPRRRLHRRAGGRGAPLPPGGGALLRPRRDLEAAAYTELAEAWRPFRTWATVLLRVAAERDGLT